MVVIFKQKNPGNVLLLLIYALALKFSMFLHPVAPVLHPEDNTLYRLILQALGSLFGKIAFLYTFLTFLILVSQATLFNRICNHIKLLPKQNYLPGMAYILITSLLPDWTHFSAPLLINSIMIWVWYQLNELGGSRRPGSAIFGIGILTGIVSLLYLPAVAFLLLVLFGLLTVRSFRVREWLIGILGFTFPYYFLFLFLYLMGNWDIKKLLPHPSFALPAIPASIPTVGGMFWMLVPFIIGGLFVQQHLHKMLIQIRKSWSLLLLFLLVAVLILLSNKTNSYEDWILMAVPFSAFHAAAYYFPNRSWGPLVLHWLVVAFIIVSEYWL